MANNKELDNKISALPPCLLEIPNDKEYAANLAGQVRQVPITLDTRNGIEALITSELQRFADEVEKEAEALAKQLPDITPIEGLPTITQELFIDAIPLERFSAIKKKWGIK